MLYSLDDIVILPACFSDIEHRSECKVEDENGKLPIFAAPMSCVINMENFRKFEEVGINTIIPRNIPIGDRLNQSTETFVALSLDEFEKYVISVPKFEVTHYICVDIANGHMKKLYNMSRLAKSIHGDNLKLMVGNIAYPDTYTMYADLADYVRLGIGSGNVCTTSANTGVHFPMASLLDRCHKLKIWGRGKAKIVADGGFNNFDQINKALALGADYVMLGQILAKSEEACGPIEVGYSKETGDAYICREYYGMSTKRAQKEFGKEGNTTAEGISKWVEVEYPIAKWVDNFKHYLRSAMSYTNSKSLIEFQNSRWGEQTPVGRMSYYK